MDMIENGHDHSSLKTLKLALLHEGINEINQFLIFWWGR